MLRGVLPFHVAKRRAFYLRPVCNEIATAGRALPSVIGNFMGRWLLAIPRYSFHRSPETPAVLQPPHLSTLEALQLYSPAVLVAVVVMRLTGAACGNGNGPIPTATAPTPAPAARSTFALFGVVSEVTANGNVPVEGVALQVMQCDPRERYACGYGPILNGTTNAKGAYIIDGVYPGPATVWVEKTGFQLPDGVKVDGEGAQPVTVNGDTRLDVQLVRR